MRERFRGLKDLFQMVNFLGKKNLNFKSGLMNGFVSGSILVGGVLF